MTRERPTLFKRRHFEAEIIILCIRWYLRYPLIFGIGGNPGRAELERRSRHDLALGSAVCAGTEPPLPPGIAEHNR